MKMINLDRKSIKIKLVTAFVITSIIPIEQNRCAMACQGCGAVFTFL